MRTMFRQPPFVPPQAEGDPSARRCGTTVLLVILLSALLCGNTVFAQPQQSENFRITKSVMDAGGAPSSSANFRLVSAFGQPSPLGAQGSANFVLYPGFLSPSFEVSPLSPIQQLVIKYLSPDNRLNWEGVAGATLYTIYRDTDPLFIPGPTNDIGTSVDTFYVDVNALELPLAKYFYAVTSSRGAAPGVCTVAPPGQPSAPAVSVPRTPVEPGSRPAKPTGSRPTSTR